MQHDPGNKPITRKVKNSFFTVGNPQTPEEQGNCHSELNFALTFLTSTQNADLCEVTLKSGERSVNPTSEEVSGKQTYKDNPMGIKQQ